MIPAWRALAASAAAAALVVLGAVPIGVRPARAATATTTAATTTAATPAPPSLALADQTTWVGPGGDFRLRINITPEPATGTLAITVYSAIPNRTEFNRTLDNNISERVIARPINSAVSDLPAGADGARTIVIATQDPSKSRDHSRLYLPGSGVYPVRVEYRADASSPPVALVTDVLYVSGPITGPRLDVAWILPIHAPPQPGPNGTDIITQSQSDQLATLASAIDAHPDLPIVLQPTPDTIAALADSTRDQDRTTLAILSRPTPPRQVVTGTYVPVPLPGMVAAGLGDHTTVQMTEGSDELANDLNIRPDGRTWVENGSIDEASVAFLRGSQVDHLVIPEQALSPNPLPVTLAQPFELALRPDTNGLLTAAADAGLAAHFASGADPILAAHQLIADLTVIYMDRPGLTRGVVVATPPSWTPNADFLRVVFEALAASPIERAATLDTLFAAVAPATVGRDQALVRTLVPDARAAFDAATFPVSALRATRSRLDGFGNTLTDANPLYGEYQRILLTSESADLVLQRDRQAQLDLINHKINEQLGLIQLPTARTITLTARTGVLPITIESAAEYPMHVLLRVDSDKLFFPTENSRGTAQRTIELHRGTNAINLTVQARTAGSFPMRIRLLDPSGSLVLAGTSFTVRSTALSGVGLFLSIGAALFLAVWWARHAWRGRRARQTRSLDPAPAAT